ncbi:paired immunoglobulin-like type 2 receptor [Anaeramoeba flamelloides]|uniref:Paired immunoglobulin-like type 2 receptor n=1 Tax=Anaeramoeba flamelloides TaxID=1746091 RepID=A0AAV7YM51_9EUKA|nr:paired immunoglobulin-like type 2 receptor [Anaeramoeba flamelloides]
MSRIILFLFLISFVVAKQVWISDKGNDKTGNGTETNPYRNPKFAEQQANDGDTIKMKPGTYDGLITTNKTLYFQGASSVTTVMRGGIYYTTPANSIFTGEMISNVQILTNTWMVYFENPVNFIDVTWHNVDFFLYSDLTTNQSLINLGSVKISGDNGFTIDSCIFSSRNKKNPYGAIFNFDVNGGDLTLNDVFLNGYDTENDEGTQMRIQGSPSNLNLIKSRTANGGNFYIYNAQNVDIHSNKFYDAPIALDSCQHVSVTSNEFINSGKYTIYTPNTDDLEHSGGIEILGTKKGAVVKDITIQKNKFFGTVRTSSILVNRWNGNPTTTTFTGVSLTKNDFSQIEQNYDIVYAINLNFSKIQITANSNYWGDKYGPKKCTISDSNCKHTENQKIRVRGNVAVDNWYCSSDMKYDVNNANSCPSPTPTPTPTPSATPTEKPKESGLSKGAKIALATSIPLAVILILLIIIVIGRNKKKDSLKKGIAPNGWKKISGDESNSIKNNSYESSLLDSELDDSDLN